MMPLQAAAIVFYNEMRLAVPADQPLGSTTLRWQLVEPGEATLSKPVVVTES